MITYIAIRDDVNSVINNLKIHKSNHGLEYYRNARINIGKEQEQSKIASLFIYLNKIR